MTSLLTFYPFCEVYFNGENTQYVKNATKNNKFCLNRHSEADVLGGPLVFAAFVPFCVIAKPILTITIVEIVPLNKTKR